MKGCSRANEKSSIARSKQRDLRSFFGLSQADFNSGRKRARHSQSSNRSSFRPCPLCAVSFPLHLLERHASSCEGEKSNANIVQEQNESEQKNWQEEDHSKTECRFGAEGASAKKVDDPSSTAEQASIQQQVRAAASPQKTPNISGINAVQPTHYMPIPGLYIVENFLTEEEERQILETLDNDKRNDFLSWSPSKFNGQHFGKRWGVHCCLRTKQVTPPENPLPWFVHDILIPKLKSLKITAIQNTNWTPNEANAIDYRRKKQHYLKSHVDNRQLSKEPIANLSLVGDCYMTFRNEKIKSSPPLEQKVLLKRRCLQVLTGEARYVYSHGIQNRDLMSDRRVSLTMRESPLTHGASTNFCSTI